MSDPSLNPGETFIKKTGGREYFGIGRYTAWLTLTNQRIILQRITGAAAYYPLSHVTRVSEYEHWQSPFSILPYKLLRIDFDNGGAVVFGVSDLLTWIRIIEAARIDAPEMPYITAPIDSKLPSFASSAPKLRWITVAMFAVSVVTICVCTPVFFWILRILQSK